MNLIYGELIKQSTPTPDWARTDKYQLGRTLHGMVEGPAFVRFVEKDARELTVSFDARDWVIMAHVA
jgi:ATP-dependent DNA helicase RecG